MAGDDLGTWLKVAAENKITTKNTWKSTLIDHFSNVDEFKENQGINFQKASCTLDGCVKVYSTRVDDVSENALRLLEGFNEEPIKKRQGKKQSKSTIEKNLSNLNIKTNSLKTSFDPKFLHIASLPENMLLISNLCISSDGVFRMSSAVAEDVVIMTNVELSMKVPPGLLVSPSVSEYKEVEDIAMEPVVEDEVQSQDESIGFDESFGFEEVPAINENSKPVFKETPFTYFKGWAGPGHWKIQSKRTGGSTSRPKEKFFMDFTEVVDHENIMTLGNTLFEQSFILKRRETQYVLPQDFRLEVEDLYKYLVRDGIFNSILEEHMGNVSVPLPMSSFIVEEPADEFVIDVPVQGAQLTRSLLPFRKVPKRVDIKRLKENIFNSVEKTQHTNLASIFKEIPKLYDEHESKEISIHFCLVSLLHLANERNIQLNHVGNNIEISLPE